ncbi:efflux RND transporter periplasmic adaptor subunit [Persicimonas caeni]|nr:efflux RND transporter periplasmic adaptor subunit [Persicimonas caeni]
MKKYTSTFALILICGLLGACDAGEEAKASSAGKKGGFKVNSAVLVETTTAQKGPFAVQGDYAGEFAAERSAEVAFEVSGRIVELDYDIGDKLEKGDVLAKVDRTAYLQKVREARAAVEMARASVGEAEVAAENLEKDLERKRPLLDKQLIAEREIENLEAQLRGAKQKIAVAKATLDQNNARLQTARENLRNTEVRAPFDAKVAARHVDLGTYVGPSQPVFRLVSDDAIYLRVNVPEQDSGNIALGKPVTLRISALGGEAIAGKVARIAPAIDPKTRMLRVDVELAPASGEDQQEQAKAAERVRPGMYAQVQLELGSRDEAVTVPKQALLEERGGKPYVWTADGGEAQKKTLLIGLRGREQVEVVEGLEGGEAIVLRGFEKLQPGTEVQSLKDQKAGGKQ